MVEIQNIPVPLTPEQRKCSDTFREIFKPKVGFLRSQIDFSSIEIRMAALMCDPGYVLKDFPPRPEPQDLCSCSKELLLRSGCKCGGE